MIRFFTLALLGLVATAPLALAQSTQGSMSYQQPASGSGHNVMAHQPAMAGGQGSMAYASGGTATTRAAIPLPHQNGMQDPTFPAATGQTHTTSGQ